MPRKRIFSDAERAAIVDDYAAGMSQHDVCRVHRIQQAQLFAFLAEAGVARRRQHCHASKAAMRAEAARAYAAGATLKQLRLKYGAAYETIKGWLREHGVAVRSHGWRKAKPGEQRASV